MTSGIELMQAHRFLQEQHHSGDLFLTKSPFIVFPKELQESIKRTEKLIVVLDTLPTPLLSAWFHAQLSQSKLGDADLVLITPDYAHITSIAPEYLFEQGRFDGMSIAERIKKILD